MPLDQKEFQDVVPHPKIGTPIDSPDAHPWYSIGPGIWELLLNGDQRSENKSVLQWYDPGTKSIQNEAIVHTYYEEVCFIRGGLKDITLGQEWGMGAYAYRRPGMKHGPYVASAEGCLQFVKIMAAVEG